MKRCGFILLCALVVLCVLLAGCEGKTAERSEAGEVCVLRRRSREFRKDI